MRDKLVSGEILQRLRVEVLRRVDQVAEDQLRDVGLLARDDVGLHATQDLVRRRGDRFDLDQRVLGREVGDQPLGRLLAQPGGGEVVGVEGDRHRIGDLGGHLGPQRGGDQ